MADNKLISKVTLGGVTYDLKDKYAREKLLSLEGVIAGGVQIEVVNELPTASRNTVGKIYLISHTHGEKDIYDEYLTVIRGTEEAPTYSWEKIGNTDIDLSDYATKTDVTEAIDGIEIGGRNLLLNSSFELPGNPNWYGLSDYAYITKEGRNDGYCAKQIGKLNENNPLRNSVSLKVKANDVFTFSGWYKVQDYVSGTTNNYVRPYIEYHKSDDAWLGETAILNISPDATDWTYVKASFKVPNIQEIDHMNFVLYARDYTGIIWWDDLKLENGNKATPWTPAPEDTEAEIQSVDNKLTTNLLKPTLETTTQNGVTCTNNGDGTYTLDTGGSTATADTFFVITQNDEILVNLLKNNTLYSLCGCPIEGSVDTFYLQIAQWDENWNSNSVKDDMGESIIFTKLEQDKYIRLSIVIKSGATINNLVFKPMLTTNLDATYEDFVPYTGSTGQINSDVAEVRKEYLPLSGGQMKDDIGIPSSRSSIDGSVPFAGSDDSIEDFSDMRHLKTFLGSVYNTNDNVWWNVLSTRHKNGKDDGLDYGMMLYSLLTAQGDLAWNKQINSNTWQGERVLLDSYNFNTYAVDCEKGTWTPSGYILYDRAFEKYKNSNYYGNLMQSLEEDPNYINDGRGYPYTRTSGNYIKIGKFCLINAYVSMVDLSGSVNTDFEGKFLLEKAGFPFSVDEVISILFTGHVVNNDFNQFDDYRADMSNDVIRFNDAYVSGKTFRVHTSQIAPYRSVTITILYSIG